MRCIQSVEQVAGKYNVSSHVKAGISHEQSTLRKATLDPEEYYYHQTLMPSISSVEPHLGIVGGQIIKIMGTGFSSDLENNSISVDGVPCKVISSSLTEI